MPTRGPHDDDDLDKLVSDLSRTLTDLQDRLEEETGGGDDRRKSITEGDQRKPITEGEDGSDPRERITRQPSVPSPGRFLRFTEEYTIPALIAMLEAHIRALELLQGVLRVINGRNRDPAESLRVRTTGRRTLDALDRALSDVQDAIDGEPTNREARDLLSEARSLREEIDQRIAGSTDRTETRTANRPDPSNESESGPVKIDVTGPSDENDPSEANDESGVNVDEELETIKQEMDDTTDSKGDQSNSENDSE